MQLRRRLLKFFKTFWHTLMEMFLMSWRTSKKETLFVSLPTCLQSCIEAWDEHLRDQIFSIWCPFRILSIQKLRRCSLTLFNCHWKQLADPFYILQLWPILNVTSWSAAGGSAPPKPPRSATAHDQSKLMWSGNFEEHVKVDVYCLRANPNP